ncbi:unnamed protein product [Protopolystoma xenopodis]|uniref:CCR4-NOT transcription complex subunit 1 domain-containing protein n=1 Tax=Protopolystoma xenopodis TaxID=117903 RepID=A0A3S5B772_9PLAT|nr:unnamed protein product [Protopolystoma xenopodis]
MRENANLNGSRSGTKLFRYDEVSLASIRACLSNDLLLTGQTSSGLSLPGQPSVANGLNTSVANPISMGSTGASATPTSVGSTSNSSTASVVNASNTTSASTNSIGTICTSVVGSSASGQMAARVLLNTYPRLKAMIAPAILRTISELITPIYDRCARIAVPTVNAIIRKDFALDPDPARMTHAATLMVKHLAAGVSLITGRSHLIHI